MCKIHIFCTLTSNIPKKIHFKNWIHAFYKETLIRGDITVRIVDIAESQKLNFKYRKKNYPTNILSFPFENIFKIHLSFLGDLIICSEVLEEEAKKEKKNLFSHWTHIVIHGCLHLIGYNHITDNDAKIMEKKEKKIISNIRWNLKNKKKPIS